MQHGCLLHTLSPPLPSVFLKPTSSRQHCVRGPSAVCAATPDARGPGGKLRFAILGGGVAGVATAYEILRQFNQHVSLDTPVEIALFDAHGIASGGSGAAAGLLHPYSPKGKPLWKGTEAMQAALELIQAAQEPAGPPDASLISNRASGTEGSAAGPQHAHGGCEHAWGASTAAFVWQHGVFRCAADDKQVSDMVGAQMTGLQPPLPSSCTEQQQQQQQQEQQQQQQQQEQQQQQTRPPSSDQLSGLQQQQQQQQPLPFPDQLSRLQQQQHSHPFLSSQSHAGEQSSEAQQPGSHGLTLCPAHLVSGQRLQQLLPGIQVPTLMFRVPTPMPHESQAALSHKTRQDSPLRGTLGTGMSSAASVPDSSSSSNHRHAQGVSGGSAAASSAGAVGAGSGDPAGFFVPKGLVLSVPLYLQQLWVACQAAAAARGNGSSAVLHKRQVSSVAELQHANGPFHAVVVAAGAAVGALADAPLQSLPLRLSQGYTLVMEPRDASSSYPHAAPSMLGQPYMAAQGQQLLIIGATQQFGFTPEASLAMCSLEQRVAYCAPAATAATATAAAVGSSGSSTGHELLAGVGSGMEPDLTSEGASVLSQQCAASFRSRWLPGLESEIDEGKVEDVAAAAAELLGGAVRIWPPLRRWRIREIRSGVRAMPPRASPGSMPLLGRLHLTSQGLKAHGTHCHHTAAGSPLTGTGCSRSSGPDDGKLPSKTWLFVGLGARGLLYHALFARQLAAAILRDDEQVLDPELRAWSFQRTRKMSSQPQ